MPTASMPRCGVAGGDDEAVAARVGQYDPAPEGSLADAAPCGGQLAALGAEHEALFEAERVGREEHHAQRQRVGLEALVAADEEVQVAQRGGVAVGKRQERRPAPVTSVDIDCDALRVGHAAARGGADRRCGEQHPSPAHPRAEGFARA